ncbi:MAG: PIN domain-containing protein [Acidobacteriota bacterium]
MIIISDTNILSSLAAGDSINAFCQLYERNELAIPPAVQQELLDGLKRGHQHLQQVFLAIQAKQIEVISLSAEEELHTFNYPVDLGDGEREAIALVQSRKGVLLTNDTDAVHYCQQRGLRVLNLPDLLRLFWVEEILSQDEVRTLIAKMEQIESLSLRSKHLSEIFAQVAP